MACARYKTRRRARRGVTLFEMVLAAALLSFLIAGTSLVFNAGQKQQRLSQGYSQDQTDERTALRDMTRAIRHGYGVVNNGKNMASSTNAALSFLSTSATLSTGSQIVVNVPQPSPAPQIELKYYLLNGTVYKQYARDTAPGTALMTGVQRLAFTYYQTQGTTRTDVTATNPETATDILMTLTVVRKLANNQQGLPPKTSALVTMRNTVLPN